MASDAAAGSALQKSQKAIAAALALQVSGWSKYAEYYARDPDDFAELETVSLVAYMAKLLETRDEIYLDLYIGEKTKQFHDPGVAAEERKAREATLLQGEREVFRRALADADALHESFDLYFDRIERVLTADASEVKVLFVGDCVYQDVISFVTASALADGNRIKATYVSSHDLHETREGIAKQAGARFDLVAYSPFTYSFPEDYGAIQRPRSVLRPSEHRKRIQGAVSAASEIFDVIADLFDCPILTHLPAPFERHSGTFKERLKMALKRPGITSACAQVSAELRRKAAARHAAGQVIYLLDETTVAGDLREAGRLLYRSRLQHPARFGALVSPVYRDVLMVVGRLLKRKVAVCDLDNTLWAGVIGEGLGITHHVDRQSVLLKLKQRGVVLAINSKNDKRKVHWDALAGQVAIEDFVSRQINWDPKVLNMRRIAQHLNLKEKDFVFIDDRADERAQVEQEYPALLTLDAEDPRSWRLMSLWADLLPAKASADRSDFYRQRDARQAFIATQLETSFQERAALYAGLGLKLQIREAAEADFDRAAELINRTNQFNMTGERVTKRDVVSWAGSQEWRVLVADAADRFGSMGTISVLVLQDSVETAVIRNFVLSCRVFGYGMEFAILQAAAGLLSEGQSLTGKLIETPLNEPCRDVYRRAGFVFENETWRCDQPGAIDSAVPNWIVVQRVLRAFKPQRAAAG